MRVVALESEDDFAGWRAAVRTLVADRVPARDVLWQVGSSALDLFAGERVVVRDAPALMLPKSLGYMATRVLLHREPQRFSLMYALLLRVLDNPRVFQDRADPQIRRVEELFDTIRRDMHKMRAFVRFREIETEGVTRFVAWFEPEHHIVRANGPFFSSRFTNMNWSILTPETSIHWDGEAVVVGPGASKGDAPADDPVEHIWRSYFRSIFNPSRLATGAMMKEMPKKYWKNMPETALVPELIAGARSRELGMIESSRLSVRKTADVSSLSALGAEAEACRRCPLWRPATQTVFGEGPQSADIMFVGEQPGDSEDLDGRPFVGPAGAVFDEALAAAGITRHETYITNAVKHFKFEIRGRKRIQAKPNAGEIDACRWWLDQEVAIVRPKLVVALGATAARSLLSRPVTVEDLRGRAISLDDGRVLWVTVHPSFILRIPDKTASKLEFERFVADLRNAKAQLERTKTDVDHLDDGVRKGG